jgi:outer membrane protein OmpA-like peptidoglycan-associated protein
VPCNIEKPEVAVVTPKPEQPIPQPPPQVSVPKPQPQTAGKTEDSIAKKQRILVELDRKKIKKDQIIRINQLYFKADSSSIEEKSFAVLNEIYEFLAGNPDVVVEIGGHTNGIPTHEYCDKLSTARAKAVADYLVNKGIMSNRLQYRGYGKRIPIESNQTVMGRQKNQRVEIKILSFNG